MPSIRIERLAFAYSDLVPLLSDVDLHLTRGFTGVWPAPTKRPLTWFSYLK